MSKSEIVALSLIREAEVSTLSAEKEMQFVQVLNNVTLVDARRFLRWYMEKTSQFYLSCLEYLLDNNPTLFTFALSMSRGGWHRRYKDRKYLVRGTADDVLTLQKRLLDERLNIRILFAYAVNYNIELKPEVLAVVKERAEKEAAANGVSLDEQMAKKCVGYAAIYDHQLHRLDRMRKQSA